MRRIPVSALALTFLIPLLAAAQQPAAPAPGRGQGRGAQSPEAQEAAARYAAADIRVMTPGVVYNAGLLDLAAAYTKETGKKVGVTLVGMGTIVNAVKTRLPLLRRENPELAVRAAHGRRPKWLCVSLLVGVDEIVVLDPGGHDDRLGRVVCEKE